jgi:DNA-binding NtrC family response regulator
MAQILALVDDLFFQAKMMETARLVGVELRACPTPEAVLAEIAQHTPKLIVIDLNARANALGLIENLKTGASGVPVIAYLSHVQTELAQQARAAGCHDVMPRSQFTRDLATILVRAKSQST